MREYYETALAALRRDERNLLSMQADAGDKTYMFVDAEKGLGIEFVAVWFTQSRSFGMQKAGLTNDVRAITVVPEEQLPEAQAMVKQLEQIGYFESSALDTFDGSTAIPCVQMLPTSTAIALLLRNSREAASAIELLLAEAKRAGLR